jgi:hypothetical protein
MRPWIAVAYSAPVAAATAVFIIYPIGQGSTKVHKSCKKLFKKQGELLKTFISNTPLINTLNKGGIL